MHDDSTAARPFAALPFANPLATAVISSLLLATALPAMATESLDAWQQQRQLQEGWAQPTISSVTVSSVAGPASATLAPAAVASTAILGNAGDPGSWRTDEFKADWGLAAMGAEFAYARGLTAKGVRLGVFDDGAGLGHPEFAGKNHRSIRLAGVLADGSLCPAEVIEGPNSCFRTDGDQVQLTYQTLEPRYAALLNRNNYFEGVTYGTHGTHVSGTIAANRDGSGMHGVAFGADLSVARLFSNSVAHLSVSPRMTLERNSKSVSAPTAAFSQLYEQLEQQQIRAINHSWGLATEPSTAQQMDVYLSHTVFADRLAVMATASRRTGLIQVWAAGNTDAPNPSPQQAPIAGMYATLPRAQRDVEPYWLAVS
ncbi:S8 family serine peptidase [Stenotrophomonas lactitubi]|uniref:S8 family serine peptidase n=1 Tax=Stenotrophomonas lactitubi TaxID=2045214 RepID=UPI00390815A8